MPRRRGVRAFRRLAWLVAPLMVGPGLANEPSGRAVGVIPDASALRTEGSQPLALQQPVYMGDRIQTGSSGEAQIHFIDNTRLVVGPASSLLIDSSVLRNRRTMSSFVVSALRGSFRFISGASPKPAYAIQTPTATIGIRGTRFDFVVLPSGATEFVLLQGEARVCDRFGGCITERRACSLILVPPRGPVRSIADREERNARLRANFRYVRGQDASLKPDFKVDVVGTCGNLAAFPAPNTDPAPGAIPAVAPAPAPPQPQPPVASPPRSEAPQQGPGVIGGGRRSGPGNGNGNIGNRGSGGGNIHGSGPGTGNNGRNNGQPTGAGSSGGGTVGADAARGAETASDSGRGSSGSGPGGGSREGGGQQGDRGGSRDGGRGDRDQGGGRDRGDQGRGDHGRGDRGDSGGNQDGWGR